MSATELTQVPPVPAGARRPVAVAAFDERRGREALRLVGPPSAALATADDAALQVLFEGELHNRDEVAALGETPPDAGDGRVVLETYRRRGPDAISRLRGRFMALIWDGGREELLCVRDPVGSHPLFYANRDGELVLSSGMEDLVAQPGVSTEVNRVVLVEQLCHRWPDPESTHYAAIRRVPPAHVLAIGRAGRRLYRYWDPVPESNSDAWLEEEELEAFDDVLERAVERCLALGPSGIFLSGGLDSVSVAAVARRVADSRGLPDPLALSLSFPDPDCNEEERQRSVARQLGIPQIMLDYDEAIGRRGRVAAALEDGPSMPSPMIGLWLPAYRRLADEGRQRGCSVIVGGGGGDELLGISPYRAADLIAAGRFRDAWRLFRGLQRSFNASLPEAVQSYFWDYGLRPLVAASGRRALQAAAPSLLRRRWRKQLMRVTPPWLRLDPSLERELLARGERAIEESVTSSDFYGAELRRGLDYPTISVEREADFEQGRVSDVAFLEPFWDPEVVEFLYRVPPELLNRGGRTKGLIRGMLARKFPDLGFERQKKLLAIGFAHRVFAAELPGALATMGGIRALADLDLVDAAAFEQEVDRMRADSSDRLRIGVVWDVLGMEAWLRRRL